MKRIMSAALIFAVIIFGMTGCGKANKQGTKNNPKETQEKYACVEKETVDVLVAKFNTETVDNSSLNPASTDYLTESDNQYWYGLIDGIYLVVVPEKYTGDKTADIVDYMTVYVVKNSNYESDAVTYAGNLIKANNSQITDTECASLMKEAREKAADGKTADSKKGISIGYLETDEYYQYQVLRNYK